MEINGHEQTDRTAEFQFLQSQFIYIYIYILLRLMKIIRVINT